ncbi:hypothetical protein DMA11_22945 [Marinilabiliaceae bacterium JC017]|nr:hypothetical protein DMA11_22945 [Marinilabiliaceae bacterium JC017]
MDVLKKLFYAKEGSPPLAQICNLCPAGFEGFESLKQKLYNKKWHVFSDKAFGGLLKMLE